MVCLKEEVLAWGKCRGLTIICDWLGVCIWLFPVHPKLTSRAKINKAISYSSGLGNFVLIAIGFGFRASLNLSGGAQDMPRGSFQPDNWINIKGSTGHQFCTAHTAPPEADCKLK